MAKRFFSNDSFWNTKIEQNPKILSRSDHYIKLMKEADAEGGFHINLHAWTIPVYEVTKDTPKVTVAKRMKDHTGEGSAFYKNSKAFIDQHNDHPRGHGPGFGIDVPIPEDAVPDKESDSHMALVDYEQGIAWDMWAAERKSDGSWWSCTGMTYDLYGSGVFNPADFPIHNGESIHLYGPSRASGVPIIAGLIMHDELTSGKIEHKLACACACVGLLEHVFPPAIWTDGAYPNGIPEGTLIQLDPEVDLDAFGLSQEEKIIAKALQEYGAVMTDYAGGVTLYGEGLWSNKTKSWDGLLDENGLRNIPFDKYRCIESGVTVEKGMVPMPHKLLFKTYYDQTGLPEHDFK
ncbi:hypothetical protein [Paenibacillus roseipurpureus]|uniref:Uncharacterized protein n=1 Tax=Paenibacillus roseopurpureus TaxID=2918901 RepID=A0AA96LTS7_9BACL|nr:hypothetical protein [Paenibacillus sp. MBLB1832]WNR44530.1 hypothetical protein MJB10_26305 [Paenibacillus sp. MBLB1832]